MDAAATAGIGVAVRVGACIPPESGAAEGVGSAAAVVDSGVVAAGGGGDVGAGGAVGVGTAAVSPAPSGVDGAAPLSPVLSEVAKANGNSSSTVTFVNSGDTRM